MGINVNTFSSKWTVKSFCTYWYSHDTSTHSFTFALYPKWHQWEPFGVQRLAQGHFSVRPIEPPTHWFASDPRCLHGGLQSLPFGPWLRLLSQPCSCIAWPFIANNTQDKADPLWWPRIKGCGLFFNLFIFLAQVYYQIRSFYPGRLCLLLFGPRPPITGLCGETISSWSQARRLRGIMPRPSVFTGRAFGIGFKILLMTLQGVVRSLLIMV